MANKHIADAEATWKVCNINPDLCIVNGKVVPFEIYQVLPPEKSNYAHTVHARGCKVLKVASKHASAACSPMPAWKRRSAATVTAALRASSSSVERRIEPSR